MTEGLVFQTKIHFRAGRSGRKQLVRGEKPASLGSSRHSSFAAGLCSAVCHDILHFCARVLANLADPGP